jgi:hypothetical protein
MTRTVAEAGASSRRVATTATPCFTCGAAAGSEAGTSCPESGPASAKAVSVRGKSGLTGGRIAERIAEAFAG